MQTDSGQYEREVHAARDAYSTAEARLLAVVGGFYADKYSATEQLLGLAEEFGANQAVTALLGCPEQFGALAPTATDAYVADMADTLEGSLEAVLVAQDRLDQAVAARERQMRQASPTRAQVVTIGGREFVIDPAGRELRSVDDPSERYLLTEPHASPDRPQGPTLTERLAEEHRSPTAQPDRSRTPTRGR